MVKRDHVPLTPAKRDRSSGGAKGRGSQAGKSTSANMLVDGRSAKKRKLDPKKKGSKNDAGQEQTFYSSADGTVQKKSLANVYKILSANTASNYYEWNGVTTMYRGAGFAALDSCQTASGAPLTLPIHLVDLTAVLNMVQPLAGSLSSITAPTNYWTRPVLSSQNATDTASGAAPSLSFINVTPSQQPFVSASLGGSTFSDAYPLSHDTFVHSQIKMNIYGALTVPQTVHVYFLKFKKGYLCPGESLTTVENSEAAAFWQSMAKPLTYNPVAVQNQAHMKDVTVIKHDVYHFSPKLSTEQSASEASTVLNPHIKTVNYFEKWNLQTKYDWSRTAGVDLGTGMDTQVDSGDLSTTVQQEDRVFMVIAGECFSVKNTTGAATPCVVSTTQSNAASFDLVIKNKHTRVL